MFYRRRKFNKGWWVTQQDRFQVTGRFPPVPFNERTVGSILPDVLRNLELKQDAWLIQISNDWNKVAGEAVASFTRPGSCEQGVLTVFVKHSIHLQELSRYGKSRLLRNLQDRFGADRIRRVTLQLEPDSPA